MDFVMVFADNDKNYSKAVKYLSCSCQCYCRNERFAKQLVV